MLAWLLSTSKNKQQLLFHIGLGWISLFTPVLLIFWYYFIFLAVFQKMGRLKSDNLIIQILVFLMYSSSFEILGRMANASPFIPYELGKYMTFFFIDSGFV